MDTLDDAAVIRIDQDRGLIQTLDFFTPVVDNPYMFGQIAAANALSDIYAMGGDPFCAMNIIGFPSCLELWVLEDILRGGADKVMEAETLLVGGHSIETPEPIFGMSVTGFVHPERIMANAGARVGDVLLLTKPLGTGIMATAAKGGMLSEAEIQAASEQMAKLNRGAAKAMIAAGAHGCTDITGFGLLGHAREMAAASSVSLHFDVQKIPVIPSAQEYAAMGLVPAGAYRNQNFVAAHVNRAAAIDESMIDLLYDPQTSGGLLIALAPENLGIFEREMVAMGEEVPLVIGHVGSCPAGTIYIS